MRNQSPRRFGEPVDAAVLGDVFSPAYVFADRYLYQSYFDTTLHEKAILEQSINDPIVSSTMQEQQVMGYAVGLHPSSQTPVAVRFRQGKTSAASQAVTLKPGQIFKPTGGQFSGLRYGLPFGWLGGGSAQLVVFTTPEAHCDWGESAEILFHRQNIPIYQPAQVGVLFTSAACNWPIAFPWQKAQRGTDSIVQSGKPLVSLTPTRTALVLRGLTSLATNPEMLALWQGTDDFGLNSAGAIDTVNLTPVISAVNWPTFNSSAYNGIYQNSVPILMMGDEWARLSCSQGGVVFMDNSGTAALSGCSVDVCRYGRL